MQFKNENYLPMKSFPLFSLEFSWKTPWKKRSYGASRTEKKQDKYRCECVNALTCEWNGQADETHIYIYTHRNFIHGLRTEKAFASITIARREPRGDWNTRIFVELFFFFFFTPRESWKVTRYKIETLPPRAEDQTYFQSHVSFPTSAAVLLSVEELFTNFFPSIFIFFFSPPFLSTIISLLT